MVDSTTSTPSATRTSSLSTATSPTGSSVTTTTAASHSSGVSSGAAAGIGVGSAFAGAVITSILLYLLWIRRLQSARRRDAASRTSHQQRDVKSAPVVGKPAKSAFKAALPQPTEDSAIVGEMSRLGTSIKNHVQSYYTASNSSSELQVTGDDMLALVGTSLSSSSRPAPTVHLGDHAGSTTGGIRFIIAWAILESIQLWKPAETTLLPLEVSRWLVAMDFESSNSGKFHSKNRDVIRQWRQVTASLTHGTYSNTSNRSLQPGFDTRLDNVQKLTTRLDTMLSQFAPQENANERRVQLQELVKRGARFGWTLFSQPTMWEFDWPKSSAGQSSLAVFPSLLQMSDDLGHIPREPVRFTEAQVVSVVAR